MLVAEKEQQRQKSPIVSSPLSNHIFNKFDIKTSDSPQPNTISPEEQGSDGSSKTKSVHPANPVVEIDASNWTISSSNEVSPSRTGLIDDYVISDDILGQGSFSCVKRAIVYATGEVVAIKMVEHDHHKRKNSSPPLITVASDGSQIASQPIENTAEYEISILKSVQHPNIVKFIDFIVTPTHYCIVSEFIRGIELFECILDSNEPILESNVSCMFGQLANGD